MRGSPEDLAARMRGRASEAERWTMWRRRVGCWAWRRVMRDMAAVSRDWGREVRKVE